MNVNPCFQESAPFRFRTAVLPRASPNPGRAVQVSHLPVENGEGMQILHYVDGQKYEAHHDFFHDKYNALPSNGGQRIATVLMYL